MCLDMLTTMVQKATFADFFAGVGLVREGLGPGWACSMAVDHDRAKQRSYHHQFGDDRRYLCRGVEDLLPEDVPTVDLAAICFPCTDLSVAGRGAGLDQGPQSSSFWVVHRLLKKLKPGRRPRLLMIENVLGLLRREGGRDMLSICLALSGLGYAVDVLVLDARRFVPQSRPRVYLVADRAAPVQRQCEADELRPASLVELIRAAGDVRWSISDVSAPQNVVASLGSVLDVEAEDAAWWPAARRDYLLSQMWPRQLARLEAERRRERPEVYTAFRRMRRWPDGRVRSTAELRTDGLAGCLRTPKGGSARQIVVRTGRGRIDARHLNVPEAARLMGADGFRFNCTTTQALFALGDGVCVPAIAWIQKHLLRPKLGG